MPRQKGVRYGGRQKGTRNKRTEAFEQAVKTAGVTPLEFLLNGLRFYQALIDEELARGDGVKVSKLRAAYAAGQTFAKDAAPYCHSRLQAIEHSGPGGGPLQFSQVERVIVDPKGGAGS